MMLAATLAALSLAADPFGEEESEAAFFLDAPKFRLNVDAWPAPAWAPVVGERLCAMTVIARGPTIAVEKFECPDALLGPVSETLAGWRWNPTSPVPTGTALMRLSFLWPAAEDPRTAVFVWPLVADGQLNAVPPDVVEIRADRRCGASHAKAAAAPVHPLTCQATAQLDWLGKPSLVGLGTCPERVRDLVEAAFRNDYQDVCPIGKYGVPIVSQFTREVTVDEGIFRPEE